VVDQHGNYQPISLRKIDHRFAAGKSYTISNRVVNRKSQLAVLTTDVPFTESEFTQPICLPDMSFNIKPGIRCETTQWDTNQSVMVHSTLELKKCNGQLCASRRNLKVENIGAPLVCRISGASDNYFVLVGVASGRDGLNQMYSTITENLDWLETAGKSHTH